MVRISHRASRAAGRSARNPLLKEEVSPVRFDNVTSRAIYSPRSIKSAESCQLYHLHYEHTTLLRIEKGRWRKDIQKLRECMTFNDINGN